MLELSFFVLLFCAFCNYRNGGSQSDGRRSCAGHARTSTTSRVGNGQRVHCRSSQCHASSVSFQMSLQMWPFLQRARGWKLTVSVGVRALLFVKTARLLWGSRPQVPTLREKGWRPPPTCPFFADPRPLSSRGLLVNATCTNNRPRTGEQCSFATRNEKVFDSKISFQERAMVSLQRASHAVVRFTEARLVASQSQPRGPHRRHGALSEKRCSAAWALRRRTRTGEQDDREDARGHCTNCMSGAATCTPALKAHFLSTSKVERALTAMIRTPKKTHTTLGCFAATGICCR